MEVQTNKMKNIIKKILKYKNIIINLKSKLFLNKSNYKYNFLFAFLLDSLNIQLPDEVSPLVKFASGIFVLALVCLSSFINISGYILSIYLINKYDIESKFPRFKKVIRYYEKSNKVLIIIEGILCILILLAIVIFSFLEVSAYISIYRN